MQSVFLREAMEGPPPTSTRSRHILTRGIDISEAGGLVVADDAQVAAMGRIADDFESALRELQRMPLEGGPCYVTQLDVAMPTPVIPTTMDGVSAMLEVYRRVGEQEVLGLGVSYDEASRRLTHLATTKVLALLTPDQRSALRAAHVHLSFGLR